MVFKAQDGFAAKLVALMLFTAVVGCSGQLDVGPPTLTNQALVIDPGPACCRLSLDPNNPVPGQDLTSSTVYMEAYAGNVLPLYDGAKWQQATLSQTISVTVPSTTNKNFDVFAFLSGGTIALETVDWKDDVTRNNLLAWQSGVLVKQTDPTRRYLGTGRTNATSGQCEDSQQNRLLWNYYHRMKRKLYFPGYKLPGSWTPATLNVWAPAAGSANARVTVVVGRPEPAVEITVHSQTTTSQACSFAVGIGRDILNNTSADRLSSMVPNNWMAVSAELKDVPAPIGFHFYQWVEFFNNNCTGFTPTSYGNATAGLLGTVEG